MRITVETDALEPASAHIMTTTTITPDARPLPDRTLRYPMAKGDDAAESVSGELSTAYALNAVMWKC